MIEEESQFPMKSGFLLIMIVALLALITFAVWMIFSISIEINVRALERATVEISDALVKSPLTSELAIFKEEELDKYHDTRTEPYIRHCTYGYRIKVRTEDKRWEFGYEPKKPVKTIQDSTRKFPVAVISNGKILPAELELKVYDTWTTRITCLVEGAYLSKDIVSTNSFNCPGDLEGHYKKCGFEIRSKDDDANSDFLCIYSSEDDEDKDCRYLPDVKVALQGLFYEGDRNKDISVLRATPVKINRVNAAIGKKCSYIESLKADKDEDAVIVMCFEEIEDVERVTTTLPPDAPIPVPPPPPPPIGTPTPPR